MCAQALAVFDISKCIENGAEITPEFSLVGESIVFVTDVALHRGALADGSPDVVVIKRLSNVRSGSDQGKLNVSSAKNIHSWRILEMAPSNKGTYPPDVQ